VMQTHFDTLLTCLLDMVASPLGQRQQHSGKCIIILLSWSRLKAAMQPPLPCAVLLPSITSTMYDLGAIRAACKELFMFGMDLGGDQVAEECLPGYLPSIACSAAHSTCF
jgi:hypothetical protein